MTRLLIIAFAIGFVTLAVVQGNKPCDCAHPQPYGYIWNLDWYSVQPDDLERTHGARDPITGKPIEPWEHRS